MEGRAQRHTGFTRAATCYKLAMALVIATVTLPASAVVIDGRDWLQPLATTNFSYNHAAEVCSTVTGVCDGAVVNPGRPSVDLTGLIWASQEEVKSMFRVLLDEPDAVFHPQNGYVGPNGDQWITDAIDFDGDGPDSGLFNATVVGQNFVVHGLTRTEILNNDGELSAARVFIRHEVAFDQGRAVAYNPVAFNASRPENGLWLYRSVPEPSVAYLLISGLMMIRVLRRKRLLPTS